MSATRKPTSGPRGSPTEPRFSKEETRSSATAFELLESKLRPPHVRDGVVRRDRLVASLDAPPTKPVVLLSAGAGWGKTTLLAQWASGSQRPFAWVSVDERDNDPIVLLTYFAVALDRISPIDQRVFEALASPGVSVEATVVPRLGAGLAALDEEVVVVLDDLHLVSSPASLDAVATLARHVPDGSQLVLSGRAWPELAVGAWRAHGLTSEVGPEDLRMDASEADGLLRAAGIDLTDADVGELTEHTEGWSAGLYLAALSISARGDNATPAQSFSGDHRLVSDYLGSELLEHMSEGDLRFLTQTAVLERLSGPLCDAVLERRRSAAALESLARSNLFLVPLDETGEWYRYHHLFQELLRAELARAEPDLAPSLLERASAWHEANAEPEMAIEYAQRAGDVDRAARLAARWVLPTYQSGRSATAERWLDWLEQRGALERNAAVAVLGALVAAVQGHPAEAERRTDAAMSGAYAGNLPDGSRWIDSWRALLRAMRCRDGVTTMLTDAEQAAATIDRRSQFWPPALLTVAIAKLLLGRVDEADDLFADVSEAGLEVGSIEAVIVALGERALLSLERGEWLRAEEFTERGLVLARHSRLEEYPTSAFLYAVAARVALYRGQAERAHELVARAQRLRPRLTHVLPQLAVQMRIELAHAYMTLADAAGAETMVREVEAILRRRPGLGTLPARVDELRTALKTIRAEAPGVSSLTTAELRVLPYLATHLSFAEIGERLYVSRHTVKSHSVAIYRKLSVGSRNAAVDRAREIGLL